MGIQPIQPPERGAHVSTSTAVRSNSPPPAVAGRLTRTEPPPQSSEPADHQAYRLGYQPASGRMFGSGN
jgi:hypothetical protein